MKSGHDLKAGEIGYIVTNLKSTSEARVGDTVTLASNSSTDPLPGYKDVKPSFMLAFSQIATKTTRF